MINKYMMTINANSIRAGDLIVDRPNKSIRINLFVNGSAFMECHFYIGVLSLEKRKELKKMLSFTEIVEFYYEDGKIITHSPDGVVRVFVNREA